MKNPMWGVTGAAYLRLKEPEYEDGVGTPRYVIFFDDFLAFFRKFVPLSKLFFTRYGLFWRSFAIFGVGTHFIIDFFLSNKISAS